MSMETRKGRKRFSMDADLFSDLKIGMLTKRKGSKGVAVYLLLLCEICKNGYYVRKDDNLTRIVTYTLDLDTCEEANSIIDACVEAGLFDEKLFKTESILTSEEIQNQYSSKTKTVAEFAIVNPEPKNEAEKTSAEIATRIRKETFYNALRPYMAQYGARMIGKFFDYWSEMNPSKTKMRFEQQKTWELGKRLAYWSSREKVGYRQKSNIASYDNNTTYEDF